MTCCCFLCSAPQFYSKLWSKVVASILAQRAIPGGIGYEVVHEAILQNKVPELIDLNYVKREQKYKNSRFDIYFERGTVKGFIEVKGVTLEKDGLSMFPDAPTKRGTKHLEELMDAIANGYEGYLFLLIQMDDIHKFTPNYITDETFAKTLMKANDAGVKILCYNSLVTRNEITIGQKAEVLL